MRLSTQTNKYLISNINNNQTLLLFVLCHHRDNHIITWTKQTPIWGMEGLEIVFVCVCACVRDRVTCAAPRGGTLSLFMALCLSPPSNSVVTNAWKTQSEDFEYWLTDYGDEVCLTKLLEYQIFAKEMQIKKNMWIPAWLHEYLHVWVSTSVSEMSWVIFLHV